MQEKVSRRTTVLDTNTSIHQVKYRTLPKEKKINHGE